MLSGITESTVINITIRIEIIISCCVKLYSAVLFMYFKHPSWNHITNELSSKESSNLSRWLRGISEKLINLFLLYSFKGIRSFSAREALRSSNS